RFFLLFTVFFFAAPALTEIYTLSLHDALPIFSALVERAPQVLATVPDGDSFAREALTSMGGTIEVHNDVAPPDTDLARLRRYVRSEEHTSELQSRFDLVCRLLLEKKKKKK